MEVYVLLTDTKTTLSKTIGLFTKQSLNHVSISFDQQLREIYSFGRKKPNNPFLGGFIREQINQDLFENAIGAVYRCSVTEEQFQRMKKFVQAIEEERHSYRYNFIGLFGVLFNQPIKREKAYFCSQFVSAVFQSGDVIIADKPDMLVTPNDFINCPHLQLVYEGPLCDYPLAHRRTLQKSKGQPSSLNVFSPVG
ncbi:hypothetical protein LRS37_11060 [Neobacillus sedimentimangrovi]|jgi:hypothetical protein|uniref:Uncharacterized protein n=1 Tax=Neobacillus sedimentimangrovi TaxID=2699460 RepID=A0ABS8QJY5_9BACI|nr:hypothetical protein [Neobacillus sedimentimangrovi]MCD4839412.1 hypothetical protein [Neobacillus sedimentimangrovi]